MNDCLESVAGKTVANPIVEGKGNGATDGQPSPNVCNFGVRAKVSAADGAFPRILRGRRVCFLMDLSICLKREGSRGLGTVVHLRYSLFSLCRSIDPADSSTLLCWLPCRTIPESPYTKGTLWIGMIVLCGIFCSADCESD